MLSRCLHHMNIYIYKVITKQIWITIVYKVCRKALVFETPLYLNKFAFWEYSNTCNVCCHPKSKPKWPNSTGGLLWWPFPHLKQNGNISKLVYFHFIDSWLQHFLCCQLWLQKHLQWYSLLFWLWDSTLQLQQCESAWNVFAFCQLTCCTFCEN